MKTIHLALALTATVIILTVGTIIQAKYSGRWSGGNSNEKLAIMAERMKNIPLKFGDWVGTIQEEDENLAQQYKVAKVAGHANITYRNKRTRRTVTVSLVCGKQIYVSKHTPDGCYVGAGYEQINNLREKTTVNLSPGKAIFFTSQFRRIGVRSSDNQRIFWSWANDGKWVTGERDELRSNLGEELYKLYVTSKVEGQTISDDFSLNREFAEDFIPKLNEALWPKEDDNEI